MTTLRRMLKKKEDDDDKAGQIIIACVKKCKCENTLVNIQKCMKVAQDAGLTPSADELSKEFSTCAKEKLLAKAAREASGESEFGPNRNMPNMTTVLDDDFSRAKNATHLNPNYWETFPSNEEKRVTKLDSVGVKVMSFKYQESTPDLSLKLKEGYGCTGSHTNDTATKQKNYPRKFKSQQNIGDFRSKSILTASQFVTPPANPNSPKARMKPADAFLAPSEVLITSPMMSTKAVATLL